MQFHAVYLQRRQPGVSYRDFQRLWRSHGDFAASVPAFWDHVRRYVHNDPIEDSDGLPGDTARFDAVGELYYTDYETWVSIRDVMWNEIAPDEKRVFNGPSTAVRGACTVHRAPKGQHKLFTFARFAPDLAADARDARLDAHVNATLATPGFGGRLDGFTVTRARPADPASGMDARPQTASNMDFVAIHHFADEDTARAAMLSADYEGLLRTQDAFIEPGSRISLLTHGWILKDDPRP